jgi:hypothetical protein
VAQEAEGNGSGLFSAARWCALGHQLAANALHRAAANTM